MTTTNATEKITKETIGNESYYNLVQISKQTRFWNPIGAMSLGHSYEVTRDKNGNILTAKEVA